MRVFIAACLTALASVFALPAHGQVVIASNTEGGGGSLIAVSGTAGLATPFAVTTPGLLTGVEVKLGNNGAASNAIVEIRSGPSLPGVVIASGSVVANVGGLPTFTVPMSPGVALVTGGPYWISIRTTGPGTNVRTSTSVGAWILNGSSWSLTSSVSSPYFRVLGVSLTGACCNPVSTGCLVLTSTQCANFGGIYGGDTSVCSVPQCLPVGACCRGLSCSLTTQPGCLTASVGVPPGRWLGPGAACPAPSQPNPCCVADINGSGARDVSDIFAFLSAWFAGCP